MKQIIISSIAFTLSISFAFAQEIFSVIDIKTFKENYDIVSARDDYGRTIQFQEVNGNTFDKKTNKPIKPLTLGSNVTADFASATVSQANYNFIKYKIVNAPYRVPCCTIKSSQLLMASLNSLYARIYYSRTGTTEVSYFIISQFTSNFQHLAIGQAIYEEHYNHKKYAIIKPWSKEEIINNIFFNNYWYI